MQMYQKNTNPACLLPLFPRKNRNFALKYTVFPMKELHLFYAPQLHHTAQLPQEEATHAVRVLRIKEGDALWATDGCGLFFQTSVTLAGGGKQPQCCVSIERTEAWQRPWQSDIVLAMAPTKNMDRVEWMAEKATEIGCDAFCFVECVNSERRVLKTERVERIVVSAMKQSHKAKKPDVRELTKFKQFITQPFDGDKFIAHCYPPDEIAEKAEKPFLFDVADSQRPSLILIGPEGDFSIEEVRAAEAAGFRSVSLGESRLRTETAALVAVQLLNLKKSR